MSLLNKAKCLICLLLMKLNTVWKKPNNINIHDLNVTFSLEVLFLDGQWRYEAKCVLLKNLNTVWEEAASECHQLEYRLRRSRNSDQGLHGEKTCTPAGPKLDTLVASFSSRTQDPPGTSRTSLHTSCSNSAGQPFPHFSYNRFTHDFFAITRSLLLLRSTTATSRGDFDNWTET